MTSQTSVHQSLPASASADDGPQTGLWRYWPMILYILFLTIPIKFDVGPLSMSGLRLMSFIVFIPLATKLAMGHYGKRLFSDYAFLLFAIWTAICLAKNNPAIVVEFFGSSTADFLGGYLIARAYIKNSRDFVLALKLLTLSVAVTLPFAIYEGMTGAAIIPNTISKIPMIRSFPDYFSLHNGVRWGINRVQGNFFHPIHYGLYCASIFTLTLVGLRGSVSEFKRLLYAAIVAACCILSLSSGPLLAFAFQIALLSWAFVFQILKARWWLLFGLIVLAYIAVDLGSNRSPIKVFFTYLTFSAASGYWRIFIFEYGMQNVYANPIFGIGLNDWVRPDWMRTGSMDNFWLLNAVRFGFPGALLLIAGFFQPLFQMGMRKFEEKTHIWYLRRAWMFTFVGLYITLTTVHVWEEIYSFTLFLFGSGLWLLNANPDDASEGEEAQPKPTKPALRRDHSVAQKTVRTGGPTTGREVKKAQYTRFADQKPPKGGIKRR